MYFVTDANVGNRPKSDAKLNVPFHGRCRLVVAVILGCYTEVSRAEGIMESDRVCAVNPIGKDLSI